MTKNYTDTYPTQPKRPIGVWLFTFFAIIFAGIAPLILTSLLLFSSQNSDNFENKTLSLLFTFCISLSIIIFGIGTFKGNNISRVIFVILVSLNYLVIGINNLLLINSNQAIVDEQVTLLGRVFRGVLYPILYIWYFTRKKTKNFYNWDNRK